MGEQTRAPLTQLLVIGVDGGEPALIEQWMASGDLPNVAKLGERSLRGRVCNPHALEAGAVWPTFHTGLLPGHQPQYDGQRYFDSQTYSDKWFDGQSVEPALWQHLSALGKRCLVIDAPYVRLDPSLDGVMILDWASHVAADGKTAALQTHPAALKDDLIARFGPDPAGGVDCDQRKIESIADHQRFLDDYLERIERKGELTVSMLEEGGWNYAETVFTGLHCVGHRLWHIRDESHPRHDAATHQAIGDPIRDSYQAFDSALGRILEVVDDRTTVLVYVSHGMGPQYTGTGLLDKMLSVIEQGKRVRSTSRPLKARVRDLWFRVPGGVRSAVRPLRKPFSGALDINVADEVPDRRTRRFFEVHANNATGGVRLNLKGREGQGLVEPAEARSILEDLRTAILDVRNAETGQPIARQCIITRDLYDGPYESYLPDLLVVWNRDAPIRVISSTRVGTIHQDYANQRTGDHTPFGMFMASGPGIEPSVLDRDVNAADFAPSLIAMMGGELAQTDGTTLSALVGE